MERFVINTEFDIGIAITGVQARARALGFTASGIDRLGTAVSELARNIIKYSPEKGGDIVLNEQQRASEFLLVLQARDNGPGIKDVAAALQDHFSTSRTLGLGLPGVKRIVDEFSIVSVPGAGTVVTVSVQR